MAIVNDVPKAPILPMTPNVILTPPVYAGISVDSKQVNLSSLLTHVEGSSWNVTYFSQILTKDNALSGQTPTSTNILQQYKKVQKYELKVTSPLTTTQDTSNKQMSIIGAATLYPGTLIPNVGDMFLADSGTGIEGIFKITVSDRKTIYNNTTYGIEYVMVDNSTTDSFMNRMGDLQAKTVESVIFVRDFLQYGQNPLIHEHEFKIIEELKEYYVTIVKRWFKLFISKEYQTILLPGQMFPTYDHFLAKAALDFFTPDDTTNIRNVRILNCDDDQIMSSINLWDILKSRDIRMLKYCFKKAGLISAKLFTRNPLLEGIYYSGINYIIYPLDPVSNVDFTPWTLTKPIEPKFIQDPPSPIKNLEDLITDTSSEGLTLPDNPTIYRVLDDDFYVLSENFYFNKRKTMSVLELAVMDYLEEESLNLHHLLLLARTSHSYNVLEQCYYTPIILLLINSYLRGL